MPVRRIQSNHKEAIFAELQKAEILIYICVAWFTDRDIFDLLGQKVREGVDVKIILRSEVDEEESINLSCGLNWTFLVGEGAKVFFVKENHNKYCVIDCNTYIIGSLNWTTFGFCRENGLETVLIHSNEPILSLEAARDFKSLLKRSTGLFDLPSLPSNNSIAGKVVLAASETTRPNVFQFTIADDAMGTNSQIAYGTKRQVEDGLLVPDAMPDRNLVFIANGFKTFQNEFGETWIKAINRAI